MKNGGTGGTCSTHGEIKCVQNICRNIVFPGWRHDFVTHLESSPTRILSEFPSTWPFLESFSLLLLARGMSNPGWIFNDPAAKVSLEILNASRCPSSAYSVVLANTASPVSYPMTQSCILHLHLPKLLQQPKRPQRLTPTSDTSGVYPRAEDTGWSLTQRNPNLTKFGHEPVFSAR
jgi:hypothetical protein